MSRDIYRYCWIRRHPRPAPKTPCAACVEKWTRWQQLPMHDGTAQLITTAVLLLLFWAVATFISLPGAIGGAVALVLGQLACRHR
jgi:hypothetical protein